jgi:hypothetical protein
MLEPCDAKVSRTVLRGLGGRKVARLLGKNAKETIWRERFGGRGLFAFSGGSNADSAPCVTPRSPGSQAGAYTIASLVCRVVPRVQTTVCWFIQSATTGFTANIFPYRNRVSLKEAFEGLEPDEAKVSRPVLRGPGPSNGARLLGVKADVAALLTFLVLCGLRHISTENFALGSLRSEDWQIGRPTASPRFVCFARIQ